MYNKFNAMFINNVYKILMALSYIVLQSFLQNAVVFNFFLNFKLYKTFVSYFIHE